MTEVMYVLCTDIPVFVTVTVCDVPYKAQQALPKPEQKLTWTPQQGWCLLRATPGLPSDAAHTDL